MNLDEYQTKARSLCVYLEIDGSQMIYPALGIVGETGEVTEKIKKLIRDDNCKMTPKRSSAIIKELGDCCWYLANICEDTGFDLEIAYSMRGAYNIQKVKALPIQRIALKLNRHTSRLAFMLEEWCYEDHCDFRKVDQYREIPQIISIIIICIEEIALVCDSSLERVYTENIENLMGRKDRGTIHGDGDDR